LPLRVSLRAKRPGQGTRYAAIRALMLVVRWPTRIRVIPDGHVLRLGLASPSSQ
jgi:hypothetical protein